MTYQRGTDLKHCPDYCAWLKVVSGEPYCAIDNTASQSDTCPREQAEKPHIRCCTCDYYEHGSGDDNYGTCFRFPPNEDGEFAPTMLVNWCGEWKERTNG